MKHVIPWVTKFKGRFTYQGIANFSRSDSIVSASIRNLHSYVGGIDDNLLREASVDITMNSEVDFICYGLVCQIILARDRKTEIRGSDDRIVVLDNDIV